jgi:hypothetical protein
MSKKSFIDSVEVGAPCSEEWSEMKGNDKVRFCSHCSKHVNNLSEMTRKEAMRFVRSSHGDLCIRYIVNPATRRPVFAEQLLQITRRASPVAAGVMSASLSLSTLSYAQGEPRPVSPVVVAEQGNGKNRNPENERAAAKLARLSGTILDPQGAVIPGVKVTAFNIDAGKTFSTTSNDAGEYKFEDLVPGKYRVESESAGFRTGVRELVVADRDAKSDVSMEVGFEMTVDVVLDVESTSVMGGVMASVDYSSPLSQAIADEDIDAVRDLIAKGADVNAKEEGYSSITPLFIAVESGNVEIVRLLLEFGAKASARDSEKQTPLMRLDDDATPELVELLVNHGVKINRADKQGNTALILVAGQVKPEVVKALIDAGADVNLKNKEGQTALMNAAEADEPDERCSLPGRGQREIRRVILRGTDNYDGSRPCSETYGAETQEDEEPAVTNPTIQKDVAAFAHVPGPLSSGLFLSELRLFSYLQAW